MGGSLEKLVGGSRPFGGSARMHEVTIQFCKSQNVNVIFKINWEEQTIPLTIPQRLYKDGH